MKSTHVAFLALVTLLSLAPAAAALASDAVEEPACIYKTERCPMGYGTVYATCTSPTVRVPLCFI
jgi:hypothetical protein